MTMGALFAACMAIYLSYMLNDNDKVINRAENIAQKKVPGKFSAYVISLDVHQVDDKTRGSGIVILWNYNEIYRVPVSWDDN